MLHVLQKLNVVNNYTAEIGSMLQQH